MKKILRALMRGVVWSVAFSLIVAVSAGLGAGLLALRAQDAPTAAKPLPVEVMTAVLQDRYVATRRFPGRIEAAQVSDIGFQVGGEVTDVRVEIGDRVDAGQGLAMIDPLRLDNRRDELIAARAEASASLTRAEATIARIEGLVTDGFATQQDLDDITAERNALRARVRQLDEALSTASKDLEDAVLSAPFAGVIVQRYVDAGVTVNPGQPVLRINASGKLEAEIGVPASFARRLQIGDDHTLISGDLQTEGMITGIGDSIDTATRTVTIRFDISDDPGFVPGSLVRLSLEEERFARGMWVPATALNESYRGLWSVYVVVENGDDNIIERKDVEIIHIGDSLVYVTGTPEDGDKIVTAAPFRFVPGQKVTIIESADNPAIALGAS